MNKRKKSAGWTALFYLIKPILPRRILLTLRRIIAARQRRISREYWPINTIAGKKPEGWEGWPQRKQFAFVLTHDVESVKGFKKWRQIFIIEKKLGFRSCFNFVPLRSNVTKDVLDEIHREGFEVGVHGLLHDGKLYSNWNVFSQRASKINEFLSLWSASGFRSPSMHHKLEWLHELRIEYDSSTFDTDPFEPQPDGVGTIFPIWIAENDDRGGYVELPYTLPQDSTLFIILKEKNIDIWRRKIDWIAEKGGMALLNTHPDYMAIGADPTNSFEYPVERYIEFLDYVKSNYSEEMWHPLAHQIAKFWKNNLKSGPANAY